MISNDGELSPILTLPSYWISSTFTSEQRLEVYVQPVHTNMGWANRGPSPTFHVIVTGKSSPVLIV